MLRHGNFVPVYFFFRKLQFLPTSRALKLPLKMSGLPCLKSERSGIIIAVYLKIQQCWNSYIKHIHAGKGGHDQLIMVVYVREAPKHRLKFKQEINPDPLMVSLSICPSKHPRIRVTRYRGHNSIDLGKLNSECAAISF